MAELRSGGVVPAQRRPVADGSGGVVPAQRRPVAGGAGQASPGGDGRPDRDRPEAAVCALIEGHLALHRGDREPAAEWFAAAAEAGADGQDRRDVVEALVGLAASTADVAVLDRLDRARRAGGITLLPQEEALLYALVARRSRGGRADGVAERA